MAHMITGKCRRKMALNSHNNKEESSFSNHMNDEEVGRERNITDNGFVTDYASNDDEDDEQKYDFPSFTCVLERHAISDGEDISVPRKKNRKKRKTIPRSLSASDLKYSRNSKMFVKKLLPSSIGEDSDDNDSSSEDSNKTNDSLLSKFRKYSKQQKLTLVCLSLINFGAYLSMSIIAPFFPIEAEQRGMSLSVIGYVFSSYALVMFVVSPLVGKMIPFVGVKFTFISGVFLAAGCNILFGALDFIEDTVVFTVFCFLLRSFEALGAAAFVTASCTIVAEIFSENVGVVFGIIETFVGLGMTVGPALGSALYYLGGYELPFYTLGSVLMSTVPICIWVLPDPQTKPASTSPVSIFRLICVPEIIITCLVIMLLCGIWGFLDPTLEPHLREFGVTPEMVGFLFLLLSATYSITCPLVGRVSDVWGFETPLMTSGLILTAFCLLFMGPDIIFPFLPRTLWLNIVALAVMGIAIGIGLIPTLQAMLDAAYAAGYEENTVTFGIVSSLFSSASSLGEFFGPALGGLMFEKYSYDFASTSISIFALSIAIVLIIHKLCKKSICLKKDKISQPTTILTFSKIFDSGIYESNNQIEDANETTPLLHRQRSVP